MNWNMKESLIGGRTVPHRQSLSVISFDGSDRSDHQVSGGKGMHWVILLLISLLVSAAFIIGILGAYKYWQKRKREKDGNEIDNELDQRNKSCPFVLIDENGTLNDAELATFVKEVKMAEGGVPYSLISTIGPQSSDQRNKSFPFVLIDKNGTLNDARLADFVNEVKMAEGGVPYFLISIIGPQSSGKSTLLNHVFRTNFTEMDAKTKRGATTHGIWLAKSPDADNCTLVMDLEGSDGNERGEDGTTFEKQAALFAFAVSDIVLINMWSNSVGCVHAASMPLLRSVFEARRKLKIHDSKTTLWFVLHDNTNPIDIIKKCLREDISQAWDLVAKGTPLSNSFEVKITVLSHYVLQRQQFYGEVVNLRQKLLAELTINGKKKRPSSGFSLSVQDLWQKIKEDKDLDLPACRVMVAKVRCEEIADKILSSFENKDWHHLPQAVQSGQVKDFGKCLNLNINEHLSLYDKETEYYDEGVRTKKRRELHDTMMKHVKPTCDTMLEYIHSQILNEFKEEFPKEFRWKRAFDKQAICDYIKSFKTKFNQRCKDTGVYQFCRTLSKSRARLLHDDMITHANEVYPGVDFGFLWATGLAAAGIAACIILGPTRFAITAACAMMRRK